MLGIYSFAVIQLACMLAEALVCNRWVQIHYGKCQRPSMTRFLTTNVQVAAGTRVYAWVRKRLAWFELPALCFSFQNDEPAVASAFWRLKNHLADGRNGRQVLLASMHLSTEEKATIFYYVKVSTAWNHVLQAFWSFPVILLQGIFCYEIRNCNTVLLSWKTEMESKEVEITFFSCRWYIHLQQYVHQ